MEHYIKIASDFSATPGARYRTDGKHSGQEFYELLLKNAFSKALKDKAKLTINLDGTYGYATSFLSEAFNSIATDFGSDTVWNNIILISTEEPYLVEEIKEYIYDAQLES